MKNTKLYIMTGLPYSGKSTLTKKLVERFSFSVASMDEVIDENNFEIAEMTQEDWNYVYSEGYERLKKMLTEGKTVVLDLGNLKRSERDTARRIAESMDIPYKLIYVNTPPEEIKRRRLQNIETKERGHLEDVSMERALNMFQEPTEDENPIIYNQDMDLEKWIKENIN